MKVSSLISDIDKIDTPLLIVGVIEPILEDPLVGKDTGPLSKLLKEIIDLGDFKGENGEQLFLYTSGKFSAKRILLLGLGKEKDLTLEGIRKNFGNASRKARDKNVKKVAICLDYFIRKDFKIPQVTEAIVQGALMGSFQNLKYKTKDLDKFKQLEEIVVFSKKADQKAINEGINSGKIIAETVNYCRELSWGPANDITPTKLAEEAERIGKNYGLKTTIFDREKSREVGLHSFLAVAKGTDEPPKFIIMEYKSPIKDAETIALIGKAITFDSGGISIKPSEDMHKMKADMSGGAIVISLMEAIAKLKLNLNVIGLVPATDNMPSGKAYHPGDVIKSYSGQTIEVISTDAEGRMIINDALTYAAKNYKPKMMFDFATLTGAMVVALGQIPIGYFANNEEVATRLEEASKTSGEKIWRMPLWDSYDDQLKSDIADLKHTGTRYGGAITAARFLSKFVMDVPWAHLDIAGVAYHDAEKDYDPTGARGPTIRLIIDLIRYWK